MSPWRGERSRRRALRLLGDAASALAAFAAAFLLRIHLPLPFTRGLLPQDRLLFLFQEWGPVLLAQLAALYFFGFYDPPRPRSRPEVARRLTPRWALQGLAAHGLLLPRPTGPSRVRSCSSTWCCDFLLLLGWRLALDRTERRRERRVAVVGCGEAALEIAEALRLHPWHGLRVVGFVRSWPDEDIKDCKDCKDDGDGRIAWASVDASRSCRRCSPEGEIEDIVLPSSGDSWQTRLLDRLAGTRPAHTNVLLLPGPFESLIGRMRYRWVHDLPLIEVVRESEWRINWPLKRLLDLVVGSLLLLLSLPVLAACAVAVRVTSPGPIFYRQVRVGRGQRPFTLLKLRTMRQDAEAESGEVLAQPGDPRLTPIGAFLRRFRLDEVPQLWNVLQGAMSLVGPRPERPGFVQRYLQRSPRLRRALLPRPRPHRPRPGQWRLSLQPAEQAALRAGLPGQLVALARPLDPVAERSRSC